MEEEILQGSRNGNGNNKGDERKGKREHTFKRELAYMVVHSFYHLLGYDHMTKNDKKEMRQKEEDILQKLDINRKGE